MAVYWSYYCRRLKSEVKIFFSILLCIGTKCHWQMALFQTVRMLKITLQFQKKLKPHLLTFQKLKRMKSKNEVNFNWSSYISLSILIFSDTTVSTVSDVWHWNKEPYVKGSPDFPTIISCKSNYRLLAIPF